MFILYDPICILCLFFKSLNNSFEKAVLIKLAKYFNKWRFYFTIFRLIFCKIHLGNEKGIYTQQITF